MLSGRQLSMEDYVKIFRRRLWLFLIPTMLGPIVALVIAKKLSPKYTSVSQILIDQPKVPTDFVPSVEGNNNLVSQLAHMEEQIRSRSRLEPIIERYGLYKKDINKVPMEELVGRMNDAIIIKPVSFLNQLNQESSGRNQVPGLQINFTADTPQLAQAVCGEITSMLIDAKLHLQTDRAQGTADFIEVELQQAKQKLDEQDAKLAAFKRQYFGSLPDQEQSTIQIVGTLASQLNALSEDLSRDQQDRTYTESLLTQQMAAWKALRTGGGNPETLQDQLGALEAHMTDLRAHFTDSYPDVIKAKADIDALKKKIAQQEQADKNGQTKAGKGVNPALEPATISQLRAQLQGLDDAIKNNQAQQARLRSEIAAYEAKLKMTPAVEQQYKDLTRDYQTTLDNYNNLLKKEDISQMSTNLQRRQEGEQFTVLDPADLPQNPSFPDYWRFSGGGLLVGLMVGFGLVLMIEMRDKALRDERDIEFFMGVPTLALIPALENGHKRRFLLGRKSNAQKGAMKTLAS